MLDAQLAIQEHAIAITTATGKPPGRIGARHPTITPFATYRASDGFFVIAAGNDAMFAKLCDVLHLPLAADPRFATNAVRCDNYALLKRLIEVVTLQNSSAHWIATLESAGLPTARVQDMGQVLQDPQLLARHMVLPIDAHPGGPAFTAPGNPIKMTTLPEISHRAAAPRLNGDRAAILDWLNGA
jgi:CoA:oxalate CoA-transferase